MELLSKFDASSLEVEPGLVHGRGRGTVVVDHSQQLPRRDVLPGLDEQLIDVTGRVWEDGICRRRARAPVADPPELAPELPAEDGSSMGPRRP